MTFNLVSIIVNVSPERGAEGKNGETVDHCVARNLLLKIPRKTNFTYTDIFISFVRFHFTFKIAGDLA